MRQGRKGPYAAPETVSATRRTLLKGMASVGIGVPIVTQLAEAAQADDPKKLRPQEGDLFVFTKGERKGEVITPDDLVLGDHPVVAFPKDPASGELRNGSRLNRVILARVASDRFSEKTQDLAADGIVGFSAICTHGGCLVTIWDPKDDVLFCPCHYSRFNPWEGGRVMGGPAPKRLSQLPVKVVDGQLVAAGTFVGRVGNR